MSKLLLSEPPNTYHCAYVILSDGRQMESHSMITLYMLSAVKPENMMFFIKILTKILHCSPMRARVDFVSWIWYIYIYIYIFYIYHVISKEAPLYVYNCNTLFAIYFPTGILNILAYIWNSLKMHMVWSDWFWLGYIVICVIYWYSMQFVLYVQGLPHCNTGWTFQQLFSWTH